MKKQKAHSRHLLSWEQIIQLLSSPPINKQSPFQSKLHSGSNDGRNKNKLRIRILDTVFFHDDSSPLVSSSSSPSTPLQSTDENNKSKCFVTTKEATSCNITQWYFTSKKGELVRRKDPSSLTLQHIYDRFCRFSLANTANASGPRIVSFGYLKKPRIYSPSRRANSNNVGLLTGRVTFTEDQLNREIKPKNNHSLGTIYSCLQCYLRPYEGRDEFYRGVYKLMVDKNADNDNTIVQSEVLVKLVRDPILDNDGFNESTANIRSTDQILDDKKIPSLQQWIKREVEVSMLKIVRHLETIISSLPPSDSDKLPSDEVNDFNMKDPYTKILSMRADFVLDDNKQLWLGCIDDVAVGGEGNLIEQINTLAKDVIDHNLAMGKKGTDPAIILPPIEVEEVMKKKLEKSRTQRKTSPRSASNAKPNKDAQVIVPSIEHSDDIQMKIAHLKMQQKRMQTAEAETLVKINNIRKEAHSKLHLEALGCGQNATTDLRQEDKQDKNNSSVVGSKDGTRTKVQEKPNEEIVEDELEQDNLAIVWQDNENLRPAINQRSRKNNEIIESLVQERDELHKSLRDEIIKHNNLRNEFDVTSRDLIELKAKSKNDIESLRNKLQNEKDRNKKLQSQIRSTTQVLEAELKVQRDYVNDLRAESWSELATKLKKEVEASVSQELTKSTMSVSQAIGSTEERWKTRIQEVQAEHENEIEKMKQEFASDLRYKLSQNELKFDMDRVSIEERLKKEHNHSLEVALRQEELLHRNNLKNESRKWEQTMMDMKIHLLTEQQHKHRKNLTDRDEHWRTKMAQLQGEAEKNTEVALENMKKIYESRIQAKESELIKTIEDARLKENEIISTLEEKAKEEKLMALGAKDIETSNKLKEETVKLESRLVKEMKKCLQIKDDEAQKILLMLKAQVGLIKKENNETKILIQEDLQSYQLSLMNEMKFVINKVVKQSNKLIEKRKEEVTKQYEQRLFEHSWKHKESVKAIQEQAAQSLDEQLRLAKEHESKMVEESLQSLAQEYEEQIQSLEYDLSWAKSQKASAEDNAKDLQSTLATNETLLQAAKDEMNSMRVNYNFEKLYIITKAMCLKKAVSDKELEKNSLFDKVECKHKEIERDLRRKIQVLEKQSLKYEQRLKLISTTLLNHRRDELLEHKTKSKEVALDMKAMNEKINEIENERNNLLNLLSHLEEEMKDVERRINEHSQISALQGSGKINIHHARKKRRLDEEYEQIISKIESKRDLLISFEEELRVFNIKKSELNDKMRGLERSLVELLVDQQKRLLSISSNDEKNKING